MMTTRYMDLPNGGRIFGSLREARQHTLQPGDTVVLRDLAELAPSHVWDTEVKPGKWHLRPYATANGDRGSLLMVNARNKDNAERCVPPAFEIDPGLSGWHAIWIGVPQADLRPRFAETGVDLALDGEPFTHVKPESGSRHGRRMGPTDIEWLCFWTCADLTGRRLSIRSPHGTFLSYPWGFVRGAVSSFRFVKLSDAQVADWERKAADKSARNTIIVDDGFSAYWQFSAPGNGIDRRLPEIYRHSDVAKVMLQSPATGVTNWPSRVTSVMGEDMADDDWKTRRLGDRRAADYFKWACVNGQEGMRLMADACRDSALEFHASVRANIYCNSDFTMFGANNDKLFNGKWWFAHPEARKPGGNPNLDYAHPAARKYLVDLAVELMTQYDCTGFNLDFTRWPPVADPATHHSTVLATLIRDVRSALDAVGRSKGRHLALSAIVVDGYHAGASLEKQRIDLDLWLKSGDLDFVCVQAWDHTAYRPIAERHGVPYFITHDNDTIHYPGRLKDPEWQQLDQPDEDPLPGQELEEEPHVNSSLDPKEYYEFCLDRTAKYHPEGFCFINNFYGTRSLGCLGHPDDMRTALAAGMPWGQAAGEKWRL